MKISNIKRRWLRRIVMVLAVAPVTIQYIYLGLRGMCVEFKQCWNFRYPE